MDDPPYHLRPNKAADRLLLIELIRRVAEICGYKIGSYAYYGFGGPFLEDMRVFDHYLHGVRMVSIESSSETFRRQHFHKFSTNLRLAHADVGRFIARDFQPGERDIFWLDYTNFTPAHFGHLSSLLSIMGAGSIVKITWPVDPPCAPRQFEGMDEGQREEARKKKEDDFENRFSTYLPTGFRIWTETEREFACLQLRMIRLQVQKCKFPSGIGAWPVAAYRYADGKPMMSCSVLVMETSNWRAVERALAKWRFSIFGEQEVGSVVGLPSGPTSLKEPGPILVDLPMLSVRERMLLDQLLPQKSPTGISLCKKLGYKITQGDVKNQEKLKLYAELRQYYPLFARVDF